MNDNTATWIDEAREHSRKGRTDKATAGYRRVLALDPTHEQALQELALLLRSMGRAAEIIPLLDEAFRRSAGSPALLELLGDARHAQNRLDDAVAAYRRALRDEPSRAGAWWGLGCALASLGDHAAAAESLRRLLKVQPGYGQGLHNLGRSLYEIGQVDQALGAFQQAMECLPAEAQGTPLTNMAMVIPGAPGASNQDILDCRRAWASRCLSPGPGTRHAPERAFNPSRPLRLGYVSAFFHKRNWMKPVWGLIDHHDRDRFQIHLFSDGPKPAPGDGYRSRPGDRFHSTSELSNRALADLVQSLEIDLLVDLNGHSKPPRLGLFALRPAPVQAAWFNTFATSGTTAFDFVIGDAHVIPASEEVFYTERVVRVPGSYLTFEVGYPVPPVAPPPLTRLGYVTFGCLAPQYKITPDVVAAWSRILVACPTSRMVLKNAVLEKPAARDFVRGLFARFSVAGDRLDLEGPAEHFRFLERYADIDIALDTFPYNGGTTTMEALYQGVPVLSFSGDRWASRISASLLSEAGLAEFVAQDLDHFITNAINLAHDPATPNWLETVRSSLRDRLRSSSACDCEAFARNMERLYLARGASTVRPDD